ncbi:mitochondrial carrier domain-containing protein [Ochromonadaceae sp. CCMP2298]|nr:mitochondrial carrier domain-containing protein [Ochromonadaceae sp. CCMP2298]
MAKDVKPVKRELNAFELCLCGAFATVFGDFVMHPIDTIKVTQQTAVAAISFLAAIKQVFSTSGLTGFYSGIVPYLISDGSSGAVKFAVFETSKKFLQEKLPAKYHSSLQFVCAAVAMLACSVILVPGEVVKTRMQAGAGSMALVVSQTLKNEGIKGLFSGYFSTLVRDVPYTMLELGVYENVKSFMRTRGSSGAADQRELTQNDELMAAAFTGAVAAFLTTPLDLVKTKLMMQGAGGVQYAGVTGALASIYRSGGMSALFVGSTARIAWLVPFTTIYLGVYESSKRKMLAYKSRDL